VTVRELDPAKARKSLNGIHKGLGLRHTDLAGRLGADLRTLWGIAQHAAVDELREQAIARIDLVIGQQLSESTATVARDYFNISADRTLWGLNFENRLSAIYAKYGDGHSPSETRRCAAAEIMPALQTDLDQRIAAWSPDSAATARQSLYELGRDLHDLNRVVDRIADTFLRSPLFVPISPATGFRVIPIPHFGDWLPTFLTLSGFHAYGATSGVAPPWNARRLLGATLLRELGDRAIHAGILVDPEPRVAENLDHTIAFRPTVVEMMTSRL
jgi:hypothetical protein